MKETYSIKKVDELISYYKNILSKLEKHHDLGKNRLNELNSLFNSYVDSGFFIEMLNRAIKGNDIDYCDIQLQLLLKKLYFYLKINEYSSICKSILSDSIWVDIKNKSRKLITSSFVLFFSTSKKKKENEKLFEELVQMKNELVVKYAEKIIDDIENANFNDFELIKKDFLNDKQKYKMVVDRLNIKNEINNSFLRKYKSIADNFLFQTKFFTEELKNCSNEVEEIIKHYITERVIGVLKEIPVEELVKGKAGLRIKSLKDGGYYNLADVYCSTFFELESLPGISEDSAYSIRSICKNYARKIRDEIGIKLSLDNKSLHETRLVSSLFSYLRIKECNEIIDGQWKELDLVLNEFIEILQKVKGGINYLFFSETEKRDFLDLYNRLDKGLIVSFKELLEEKIKLVSSLKKIDDNLVWEDFRLNSIKYYNAIEEICPGALDNDDKIYGLDKDLAREIQDQCYFPDGLLCALRRYQEWGVKYILHQEKVLLGDEMGLGKTIQAIATMVSLKNTGATHFLVICPASVVTNWCREICKHSKLKVIKIHGQQKSNAMKSWKRFGGVGVTNYESTSIFMDEKDLNLSLLVVDEAHYIKNSEAIRSINTKELAKHSERLLFMTGTALENNVEEMIKLIEILNPQIAGEVKGLAFMSSASLFKDKIAPVYYRRKREQVLSELPDKIEVKEWCSLSKEEEECYEDAMLGRNFQAARRVSFDIDDLNLSSKAKRLKEIVIEAEAEERKILVFSFFLDTIRKLYEYLGERCLNPINGTLNLNRRQEIIDEFDSSPAGTVLLAQINSGGTGLNIQSASVVIICEPQFKPSIENQAIARVYRMGQTRNVLVYRLLCENTIEEKMIDVLEEKQRIFDTFADESVAGKESLDIDEKSFKQIITEEIERINKKREDSSN